MHKTTEMRHLYTLLQRVLESKYVFERDMNKKGSEHEARPQQRFLRDSYLKMR
jgi:hypothetical protein